MMQKQTLYIICGLGLALLCGYTYAQDTPQPTPKPTESDKVYKSVGPGGETIYSDQPSADSKEMNVPKGDSYKPVRPPGNFTPYQPPKQSAQPATNTVSISSPTDKETIWSAPGELTVSVNLGNALGPGQELEYMIDGKKVLTSTETSHTFQNIFRGEHVITVRLVDPSGTTISSKPVTVYVRRPFKKH